MYKIKFYTVKLQNVSQNFNGFILQDCGNVIAVIWYKMARWLCYYFFTKNAQKVEQTYQSYKNYICENSVTKWTKNKNMLCSEKKHQALAFYQMIRDI